MGNICEEGFLIPVYVMFFCEIASYDILNRKRDLRIRYIEDALLLIIISGRITRFVSALLPSKNELNVSSGYLGTDCSLECFGGLRC